MLRCVEEMRLGEKYLSAVSFGRKSSFFEGKVVPFSIMPPKCTWIVRGIPLWKQSTHALGQGWFVKQINSTLFPAVIVRNSISRWPHWFRNRHTLRKNQLSSRFAFFNVWWFARGLVRLAARQSQTIDINWHAQKSVESYFDAHSPRVWDCAWLFYD